MRYCPKCLEEYRDGVESCAECAEPLVAEEELANRPEFCRLPPEQDAADFAVVGPAEDPFEADAFVSAVGGAGIPVLARMRPSSPVDALASAQRRPWWEILVPRSARERAAQVIEERRKELKDAEADAALAAEEEELETEGGP
jgi:hypothetical protein